MDEQSYAAVHTYRGEPTYPKSIFESAGLLAACKDCGSAIVCGELHSGIPLGGVPQEAGHHMVTFLHRCESAQCKLDILARGWESRMVPYAVTPGSDVGVACADYRWLLKQCKAKADWQLPERLAWSGRLIKDKAARFQYRGSLETLTQYVGDGADDMGELKAPPFGEWRARGRALRQEPEWTLNDLDVAEAWRQVDKAALDKCSPAAVLDLAADVVSTLGRWPASLQPGFCPQERRLEVRLALVLNAYLAKAYSTHPKDEIFDAIRHKKRLQALRHQASSVAQPAPDADAASRWRGTLRELRLDARPVEAEHVFRHTPSKTISAQNDQKQVLEKFGAYKPLKLWNDPTNWEKFFVFNKDFVDFNRSGMRAEDPNAHKWRESKVWVDYTELVSSDDWANALPDRYEWEVEVIKDQLRKGTSRSDICPGSTDVCCPWTAIWDWYVKTHGHREASTALREARAKNTGSWLKQKLSFSQVQCELLQQSGGVRSLILQPDVQVTKYTQYKLHCVFSPDFHFAMPFFLWAGGTYARREADFPEEQSTATWLETHILPLGIKAPGFRFCRSVEQVLTTWEQTRWYGKAPHRLALSKPFPYATASMREFVSNRGQLEPRGLQSCTA